MEEALRSRSRGFARSAEEEKEMLKLNVASRLGKSGRIDARGCSRFPEPRWWVQTLIRRPPSPDFDDLDAICSHSLERVLQLSSWQPWISFEWLLLWACFPFA